MDALAVVGSTRFVDVAGLELTRGLIEGVLDRRRPDVIVSGGARGVDTLAATIAGERQITLWEFAPHHPRWEPQGYKQRNDIIAERCTRLMRVVCRWSHTYGSGYTHDRARTQGKLCWSVRLPTSLAAGLVEIDDPGAGTLRVRVRDGRVVDQPGLTRALGWAERDADRLLSSLVKRRHQVRWFDERPAR